MPPKHYGTRHAGHTAWNPGPSGTLADPDLVPTDGRGAAVLFSSVLTANGGRSPRARRPDLMHTNPSTLVGLVLVNGMS